MYGITRKTGVIATYPEMSSSGRSAIAVALASAGAEVFLAGRRGRHRNEPREHNEPFDDRHHGSVTSLASAEGTERRVLPARLQAEERVSAASRRTCSRQ